MVCRKCNGKIDDNSLICPYCKSKIENLEVLNGVSNNLHQVENVQQYNNFQTVDNMTNDSVVENHTNFNNEYSNNNVNDESKSHVEDKTNIGLVILSWFIPLAGFIIFFVKKDSSPKTAKASGLSALISFILGLLISIFFIVTLINFTNKFTNGILELFNYTEKIVDEAKDEVENVLDETKDKLEEIQIKEEVDINEFEDIEMLDNDWKKYEVKIKNKKVVLPVSYSAITFLTDASMKTVNENENLAANHYKLINLYRNNKFALHVEIYNETKEDILIVNGKVVRVMQSKLQVDNGAEIVYFPGNLKAGDSITHDSIIELFGEPTNKKEYNLEGYNSVEYIYNEDTTWTTTKFYKIKLVNGVIDELTLDNKR